MKVLTVGNETKNYELTKRAGVYMKCRSSPRRSQLDSCFVERGTLQINRLRRAAVIAIFPWKSFSDAKPNPKPAPEERRDPLALARYYQALLDSGKFES